MSAKTVDSADLIQGAIDKQVLLSQSLAKEAIGLVQQMKKLEEAIKIFKVEE